MYPTARQVDPRHHGLLGPESARHDQCPAAQVLLWNYPNTGLPPRCIHTRHSLNIFGVEFLPGSNSSKVVTAAFDATVQLHDLGRSLASRPLPRRGRSNAPPYESLDFCHTTVFHNHSESVKVRPRVFSKMMLRTFLSSTLQPRRQGASWQVATRAAGDVQDVAVEPGNASCFWSAAHDGRCHEFDMRCPGNESPDARNMLIKAPTSVTGHTTQFKSLDINKVPLLRVRVCASESVPSCSADMLFHKPSDSIQCWTLAGS